MLVGQAAGVELRVTRAELAPWHPGRCAALRVGDWIVGHAGELHPKVVEALGLPARTCAMELDLDAIPLDDARPAPQVSPYPPVSVDVALVAPAEVPAAELADALLDGGGALLEDLRLFDVYTGEQVGPGQRSLAFSLRFRAPDRTLTSEEANAARDAAVAVARAAARRGAARLTTARRPSSTANRSHRTRSGPCRSTEAGALESLRRIRRRSVAAVRVQRPLTGASRRGGCGWPAASAGPPHRLLTERQGRCDAVIRTGGLPVRGYRGAAVTFCADDRPGGLRTDKRRVDDRNCQPNSRRQSSATAEQDPAGATGPGAAARCGATSRAATRSTRPSGLAGTGCCSGSSGCTSRRCS